MTRRYHLFRHREHGLEAVPAGVTWGALPLPWLWAFRHGMPVRAAAFLTGELFFGWLGWALLAVQPLVLVAGLLLPRIVAAVRGGHWRALQLEEAGREALGTMHARSAKDAVAQVARRGGELPRDLRARPEAAGFTFPPAGLRPFWAVAGLTVRAAFRYRLVVVLLALLLGAVIALPLVVKHDGTASGFTQILLTYTLATITALLSLVTVWLSCNTLARDIDECQMQMVAVKPIPRWQIWLGKWCGIMTLNALLLGLSAGAVYLLMLYRAQQLPPEVRARLRAEVLTARAGVREPLPNLAAEADRIIAERRAELLAQGVNLEAFRAQAKESVKARMQVVPVDHFRRFQLPLGRPERLRDEPMFIRMKFFTPDLGPKALHNFEITVGEPETANRRVYLQRLVPENFFEFPVHPNLFNAAGVLTVDVANRSTTPLILPLEDGFEVLYREGGFGLNFLRGLAVIVCWLALLAALGLAAASFLSFPVAAFVATAVLVLGMSSGTLKTVVEDNTVLGVDHDTGQPLNPVIDAAALPVFRALFWLVEGVQGFSPINALGTGRSVSWGWLARAFLQIVVLMGGLAALAGMVLFQRRELATAPAQR
ncbi:MAG: hypothetical protein ACKVYV_11070 [Limisphaerales bacterium]